MSCQRKLASSCGSEVNTDLKESIDKSAVTGLLERVMLEPAWMPAFAGMTATLHLYLAQIIQIFLFFERLS